MTTKNRGLGRGLDALLGGGTRKTAGEQQETGTQPSGHGGVVSTLGIELIQRGRYQPRRHFDEEKLQELADSIAAQGVVQPIVVRAAGNNSFEIVAGERRWRAAQLAGLENIPAVIKHFDDQTAAAVSLIENIQRENLNPLEESVALQRLIDEFGMTHQQVADTVARSRTAVTNLLRLQDLNADVKHLLAMRDIDMGHARALLAIDGAQQSAVARDVAKKGLSVRETENLVRRLQQSKKQKGQRRIDPDIQRLQNRMSEQLGARVRIQHQASGKGRLVISYNSADEFDGILERLKLAE